MRKQQKSTLYTVLKKIHSSIETSRKEGSLLCGVDDILNMLEMYN